MSSEVAKAMKPSAYGLIVLGEYIHSLAATLEVHPCWEAIEPSLNFLCEFREIHGVEFVGLNAEEHVARLHGKYLGRGSEYLETQDRFALQGSVKNWEGRLQELSKKWVLSFPQTHIDVEKLLRGAKAFLNTEQLKVLQPLEEQGLDEAASCLLYNNFTSSEFMALRTAESLLRRWYERKTGEDIRRAKWGIVLDKLDKEFPKETRPKELSLLDYLRGRRNEIAHPEAISSSEQATATFLNVIAVLMAIKSELVP